MDYNIGSESLDLLLNYSEEDSNLNFLKWLPLIESHLSEFRSIIKNVKIISYFNYPIENDDLEVLLEGLKRRCSPDIKIHMFCREKHETFTKFCDYIHENSEHQKILAKGEDY